MPLKDYFNSEQRNQFMVIGSLIRAFNRVENKGKDGPRIHAIADSWEKQGLATKEELKYLRTATTYLEKFYDSVLARQGAKEQDRLRKMLGKFDYKLIDDYTLQRIMRDMSDKLNYAVMKREDFENWSRDIMYTCCRGCKKDWKECDLYDALDDNFIPESSWGCDNCKYADPRERNDNDAK